MLDLARHCGFEIDPAQDPDPGVVALVCALPARAGTAERESRPEGAGAS
jgi:hypothetical protein